MKSKEQYVFDHYQNDPNSVFWKAYYFAYEAHKNHQRRDGAKYIVHPLEGVYTQILLGIEDEIDHVVMMLHDVIEETTDNPENGVVTVEMIEEVFKQTVAQDVKALTKKRGLGVKELIEYFTEIEKEPRRVNIKMIDRYINIRRGWFGVFSKKKIEEYTYETVYYILPMSERIITLAESECCFTGKDEYKKYAKSLRILRGAIKGIIRGGEKMI